jgi:hypothetical protein
MRDVTATLPDAPPLQRSVVACLASILERDVAEIPVPAPDHPEPFTVWRNWLATQGLGLVPIAEPRSFDWPGPWLALLRAGAHAGHVAVVAYGAPPGVAWRPLRGTEAFDAVEVGYVVAATDPVLAGRPPAGPARRTGRVEAIVVAPDACAPAVLVAEARAEPDRGLEGDRYFEGRGTFSSAYARGHDLTLIDRATLDDLSLAATAARRNLVTSGIDLDALVGRSFRVGDVECRGQRACEPCAHLERLTAPGTLRALVHRGGLRADILTAGVIRVDDPVEAA